MNQKTILYQCLPLLLSIMVGLPSTVRAEAVSTTQINETLQPGIHSESNLNSTTVQGSLTDTLVKKLGISSEQARCGAGAVFLVVKGKVDAGQFAELSKIVPEMDDLLSAATKQAGSVNDQTGDNASGQSELSNPYGNLSGLGSVFKSLNLSPDMSDEFVPAVVDYVRTKGGDLAANMLQSALYGGF